MSVVSPNSGRLLLFGKDKMLLDTRALVLQSAHFVVDITDDIETLKKQIAYPKSGYRAVICCYTAADTERDEILALTSRSHVAVLQLVGLVQPVSLIAQVSALLAKQR